MRTAQNWVTKIDGVTDFLDAALKPLNNTWKCKISWSVHNSRLDRVRNTRKVLLKYQRKRFLQCLYASEKAGKSNDRRHKNIRTGRFSKNLFLNKMLDYGDSYDICSNIMPKRFAVYMFDEETLHASSYKLSSKIRVRHLMALLKRIS